MEGPNHELINSLVREYAKIERLGASILEDKQQIIDLDHRRNKTREALRQVKTSSSGAGGAKTWMCLGNTFFKVDSSVCEKALSKDQKTLDAEVSKLRDGLKPKVNQLHKMEGAAEVKGFELKGMRVEEMLNITSSTPQ